jgi:hypothetical protein
MPQPLQASTASPQVVKRGISNPELGLATRSLACPSPLVILILQEPKWLSSA